MKRVLKWVFGLFAACLLAVLAVFVGTRGDYPVRALAADDPSFPSETIDGIDLHVRTIEGPQGAATVIVLHGGPGGDFRSLQALSALADSHRVVFYDQRGAGLSERVRPEALTLDGHIAELGALIDHVAPGETVGLIGHSWGAMLATAYLGHAPARIDRAVLIEPGFLDVAGRTRWNEESRRFMSGAGFYGAAVLTGIRALHVDGPDPDARGDFLVGRMVHRFTDHPDNPYHCGAGFDAPNWRFGAVSSQSMARSPASDIDRIAAGATAYDGQVLLMAGECDDWLGEPLQRQHLDRFADADLVVIPDAGHDVIWDNPEGALTAIRAFLLEGS